MAAEFDYQPWEKEQPRPYLTGISIGKETVRAYGHDLSRGPVYIESNFGTPAHTGIISGIISPYDALHEASLVGTSVREGEVALIPHQVPGVINYWRSVGLTPFDAGIEQVNVHIHEGDFRYPHTDPLAQLYIQDKQIEPGYYVGSFPHNDSKTAAASLGLHSVQEFNPSQAGDKLAFHNGAEEFGYQVAPYAMMYTLNDLRALCENMRSQKVADLFEDRPRYLWIKLRNSSGGMGVFRTPDLRNATWDEVVESFTKGSSVFRRYAEAAFTSPTELEQYWASESPTPNEGLLVEMDLGFFGTDGESCSNILVIHEDGVIEEAAEFVQIVTDQGTFLGSALKRIGRRIIEPDSPMYGIGKFFYSEGVRGSIGIDYKYIIDREGTQRIFPIEGNVRPPLSQHALIAYENFINARMIEGHEVTNATFANTVITLPHNIYSIEDLLGKLEPHVYRQGDRLDLAQGHIVPIGIGSYVADGRIVGHNETRILIIADSSDRCAEIIAQLKSRGL